MSKISSNLGVLYSLSAITILIVASFGLQGCEKKSEEAVLTEDLSEEATEAEEATEETEAEEAEEAEEATEEDAEE